MNVEAIGWLSSGILLLTLGRQVFTQWVTKATGGVSKWLFLGQVAASCGFATYSWLLENWVFLFTNTVLVITAVAGELVYLRNRRHAARTG